MDKNKQWNNDPKGENLWSPEFQKTSNGVYLLPEQDFVPIIKLPSNDEE